MTEDQIERKVELMFNHLDAKLMRSEIDQRTYDRSAKDISAWADNEYRKTRSPVPCAQ